MGFNNKNIDTVNEFTFRFDTLILAEHDTAALSR